MVAYLLDQSHTGCQAFLGGISRNFDTNLLLSETSSFLVAEADEYDRSFLHLHPYIAIITSIDSDHLDIYHTHEAIHDAFISFASNIVPEGYLIVKKGLEPLFDNSANYRIYTYAVNETANFYASNLQLVDGLYHFDFNYPGGKINDLTLGIPGFYNVENAVAAIAASILTGATPEEISKSLISFKGVKRRFDIRLNKNGIVYIDDYAHHPEELKACINSARVMFPGKKITGIFQPHLFSRTNDFKLEFAKSLSALDEVLLLPIYAARELPIPGVDSKELLLLIKNPNKKLIQMEDIPECFNQNRPEVLLTMGAGDIDSIVAPIEGYFSNLKTNF
jgi:UDP-N-acetylmuramate--alanine ligase